MRGLINRLGSLRLTMFLFLFLALLSALGTFLPPPSDPNRLADLVGSPLAGLLTAFGLRDIYHSPYFIALLVALSLNMLSCMISRIPAMLSALKGETALKRRAVLRLGAGSIEEKNLEGRLRTLGFRQKESGGQKIYSRGKAGYIMTLTSHASILIIMIFSLAGSMFGYVGTQRVYVGDSTDQVFNWKVMKDTKLPFLLHSDDLVMTPNPVSLRIGIKDVETGKKGRVITTYVGGSFKVPDLAGNVKILDWDLENKVFTAQWIPLTGSGISFHSSEEIGDTDIMLVPVAFAQWPGESMVVAKTTLIVENSPALTADVRVNHPISYEGTTIYLTDYGSDRFGLPYVGFQFVRDPGQAGVWVGCVVFLIAVTGAMFIRHSCVVLVSSGNEIEIFISSRGDRAQVIEEVTGYSSTDEEGIKKT